MRVRHGSPLLTQLLHRRDRGAICTAPAQHQQFACRVTVDLLQRDIVRNAGNLLVAQHGHLVVIVRIIADVPGDIGFFYTANAML